VYRDWRKIAEGYSPAKLLLGETWVSDLGRLASYYGDDDELQLAFNFPAAFADFSVPGIADVVAQTMAALPRGACPVWTGSNHDLGRFATRWCAGDERRARLALLVLSTLPGTVVLYYGDEIGMTDVDVPAGMQRDVMTLGGQNPQGNRDRARTPMRWNSSPSGGFTGAGVRPWLPIGPAAVNVADQRADTGSTLWLTRRLLTLRRAELGGSVASFERLPSAPGVWAYRTGPLQVVANLTADPARMPESAGELLLRTGPEQPVLGPWEGLIARPRVS
jgi:alpha-glucosidase